MTYRLKRKTPMAVCQCPVECKAEEPKKFFKVREAMEKIGKRNMVVAGSVLLIGAAVWLNWSLFTNGEGAQGYPNYDQPAGVVDASGSDSATVDSKAAYFSATQVNRQRARDEALEVLQNVVDNVDADPANRAEALAGITSIAEEMQKEANVESLIMAKGFNQCVAVLNGTQASIVVEAEELLPAQIAQIKEIVYSQTGITPAGVTIINK